MIAFLAVLAGVMVAACFHVWDTWNYGRDEVEAEQFMAALGVTA